MCIGAPTCSTISYADRRGFETWREGQLQDASAAAREQRELRGARVRGGGWTRGSGPSSPCFSWRSEVIPGEVAVVGYGGSVRRLRRTASGPVGGVLAQTRCSSAPGSRPSSPSAGVASSASPPSSLAPMASPSSLSHQVPLGGGLVGVGIDPSGG